LLLLILSLLQCDADTRACILIRWKWAVRRFLKPFAPYAYHCFRVQLIFYAGMFQGVFPTRSTNIVDLEYLHYTPFANIFCSGDSLHRQMAPFVLQKDQSFVERDDLRSALNELVEARSERSDAEPGEKSVVRELWMRHWKQPPQPAVRRRPTEEETKRIMESAKPFLDAINEYHRSTPRQSGPRFPV
jgi:hypothetical protein